MSFVGYPTAGGSGTAVSFRGNELAINAKAENQEVAWEFVKYYLLNGYTGEGFPVVTAQFDKVMAESMEPTMITSVEGTYEVAKGTYQGKGTYIEVFTATQADVEAVKKLVEEADNRYEYNTEILNIRSRRLFCGTKRSGANYRDYSKSSTTLFAGADVVLDR